MTLNYLSGSWLPDWKLGASESIKLMLEMLEKREINACMLNISVSHVGVAVSRIRSRSICVQSQHLPWRIKYDYIFQKIAHVNLTFLAGWNLHEAHRAIINQLLRPLLHTDVGMRCSAFCKLVYFTLQQRAQLPATKFLASAANNCGSRQILCFLRRAQSFARPTSHWNGYYEPATTAEIIRPATT